MKRIILLLIAVMFTASCSDSTSPDGNRVVITSEISQSVIKSSVMKNAVSIQNSEFADSLVITDFKMLISRVKFHGSNVVSDDSTFDDSKGLNFVTGAFIIRSDSANKSVVFADAELKAGTYNKIKVEMHRLTPSDINNYLTKPYFEDFVTAFRPTFVIRGKYYQQGQEYNFTFLSDVVLNHTFNLNPPVVIANSGEFRFVYELDSSLFFKDKEGNILVPNYGNNNKTLEKNIKNSMKMKKK
jgi:hypothetical protein